MPTVFGRCVWAGYGLRMLRALALGALFCGWLWAGLCATAWAGSVTIVDDPDVDQAASEAVQQAVDATLDYFRAEYGLTLDHDVRLVLAADKENFIEALIRRSRHTPEAAADRAGKSVGLSMPGMIVENVGHQDTVAKKIFVAAHELTHQFQDQMCRHRQGTISWLSEGMANAIAAKIVEQEQRGSVSRFREHWQRTVRAAKKRPFMAQLRDASAWRAAESRFGGDPIYGMGSLAVLDLIDLRGEHALFDFYTRLRTADRELAFQDAFGRDLSQFEREYD